MQRILTMRERAAEFLVQRTIAVLGVSRTKRHFSRDLVRVMQRGGYAIHAVNPQCDELDGVPCYRRIGDVPQPLNAALLMVPEAALPSAIRECIDAGISQLWIYGVGHPRKLDDQTRMLCGKAGVTLINGLCPRMFLNGSAWPHRLHGWIAGRSRAYRLTSA